MEITQEEKEKRLKEMRAKKIEQRQARLQEFMNKTQGQDNLEINFQEIDLEQVMMNIDIKKISKNCNSTMNKSLNSILEVRKDFRDNMLAQFKKDNKKPLEQLTTYLICNCYQETFTFKCNSINELSTKCLYGWLYNMGLSVKNTTLCENNILKIQVEEIQERNIISDLIDIILDEVKKEMD